MEKNISKRSFGNTGHKSSALLFGGYALNNASQREASTVLDILKGYGVNHIDTAPSYGDSELRIGSWMKNHREDFFLATKIDKRTYQEAKKQLHSSLERLHVDQVDLIQFHNLTDPEEWETVFGDNGALKAAKEARKEGLVRFIGVTGHGIKAPSMHRRSLQNFEFDSVLLPLNYPLMQNPAYARDFRTLLHLCNDRGVAVQTIKAIAERRWKENEDRVGNTWYKPLRKQERIDKAVHWALSHPNIFVITAGDRTLLPKLLDAATRFRKESPPSDKEMEEMVSTLNMAPLWPE